MTERGDPFPFFHLLSSDYSLDDLSTLTSAQLAAAWVLHPDYDEAKHSRKIAKLWRSRREKGRHLIGNADIGVFASDEQRAQDPCFGFELIDLGTWDIPDDLSTLSSAQLAALPFHPQFKADTHAEPAEDLFYKRRDRGGGASMLDAISGKVVVPTDVSTPSTMPKKSSAPPVSVPENGNATGNAADLSATTDVSAAPAFPAATQSSEEHAVGAITSNIPASESQRAVDASKPATSGEKESALQDQNLSRQSAFTSASTVNTTPARMPQMDDNAMSTREDGTLVPTKELIPEGLVETWSILHLNGISRDMPDSVVWSLLSPPHLPPPIAVKLRPARPAPGYAESNFYLCFAAYRNEEDSDLAQRGLNGATFGKNTVKAERSVSKRRAAIWEWSMLSPEFRESLKGVDLSQYPMLTVSARVQQPGQSNRQNAQRSGQNQRNREQRGDNSRDGGRRRDSRPGPGFEDPNVPPNKRKRRDQDDNLPPALVDRLACVQIYNLPLHVSVADVYHYFPPAVIAGAAVTTDQKDVNARKPAPGRIFLAFEDPELRREIINSHVTKQQFPGCDRTMWYRTDDVKEGGWRWSEMSDGFKMRHGKGDARPLPPGPPPPGMYGPRYDWPPPSDPWARPGPYDYPLDYGPPRGSPAGGPSHYYGRPDDYSPPDYGRFDAGYAPGADSPYGPGPAGFRPADPYARHGMPPGPPPHGYPGPPPPLDRSAGPYGAGPPPDGSGRRGSGMHQSPPHQTPYDGRPPGYGGGRYDGELAGHGSPPPRNGARTPPAADSYGSPAMPHDSRLESGASALPAPQADLESLLATLKQPEDDAQGRKRDWDELDK